MSDAPGMRDDDHVALFGTTQVVPCEGHRREKSQTTPCPTPAVVVAVAGGSWGLCRRHVEALIAEAWFHGPEYGYLAAIDADGIWRKASQGWSPLKLES